MGNSGLPVKRTSLACALLLLSAVEMSAGDIPVAGKRLKPGEAIKVGFFHGGRTDLLLRLYEHGGFARKGLNVEFYAAKLRSTEYQLVPQSIEEFDRGGTDKVGKTKGSELIDGMFDGKFDLAMVGESSFIHSVYAGKPIVAIAELGHDVKGQAGHVFLMRKGLKADKPQDYFGKVLVSRRAGPGDAVFLREYLEHAGVSLADDAVYLAALPKSLAEKERLPKNKVFLAEDVYEDDMRRGMNNGVIDGGYFHLMGVPKNAADFNVVKSLDDFANPEMSLALLICTREFLNANRESLTLLLEAYIERIKLEHGLSYEERTKPRDKGLQMALDFGGLNYPQYDLPPTINAELLNQMARLLRKHRFVGANEVQMGHYVDNSLVLAALKKLNITEKDDHRRSKF